MVPKLTPSEGETLQTMDAGFGTDSAFSFKKELLVEPRQLSLF
tara:strand:+ start:48 stop:176 length:129 start_codon:yes stop_codon:yes gene_type:complete